MEAIGTLAGGVAHDFNNILQVALGYSEFILQNDDVPEHYRADLQKIHESAKLGSDLVKRLLTFSRKTEIRREPLDLNLRITELRKMLQRTLPKMVDIQLILDGQLAKIHADPTQIEQVLMNLAVNARDAMPNGGRLVFETTNIVLSEKQTRTNPGLRPGDYVRLVVRDTGSGIDKADLEHIFEPFYTTKAVGEGTGLGLPIVHGIVTQHDGFINCESEYGEGTTFNIYFPALVADESQEGDILQPLPQGGTETVLLVDDEEFIRDVGSRFLSRAGYKVLCAANGQEGLEVFKSRMEEISVVILDLMMPHMGGRQCMDEILKLCPSAKIIIASGYHEQRHSKDLSESGAKGFINKPYEIRQLLGTIRTALDSR
jgi:CheY-like chemotaxis protein